MIFGNPVVFDTSGIPCTVTINTVPGVTLTATFGDKNVTTVADESGIAVLVLDKEGVWTVTATDGNTSNSIEVDTAYAINKTIEFS